MATKTTKKIQARKVSDDVLVNGSTERAKGIECGRHYMSDGSGIYMAFIHRTKDGRPWIGFSHGTSTSKAGELNWKNLFRNELDRDNAELAQWLAEIDEVYPELRQQASRVVRVEY